MKISAECKDAMKIAFIAPVPPFRGGIAKYCYSLAKELEKRHDLLLLSYRRQYPALLYGRKSQTDPQIDGAAVQREFGNLSFDIDSANPLSWAATSRRIAAFGTELVILPWWVVYWAPMYLYLLRSFRKRGIRVVVLCINVFEHEDSLLKKSLTKLVLRSTESIIVHSEQEKNEILEFHPKATVIKHLLPLFHYEPCDARPQDDSTHLLFFGFVRPYKGLDTLLKAVALLGERKVTLTVAGEFWNDRESYQRMVEELGISDRVRIIDQYLPDSEMGRFFARADLVVLPYRKSRTSGIIATAYGYGKPVLATDVGGFHEVVEDGSTGKLVPPDDPEAFAAGIRWFLDNRRIDFAGNIERFAARKMSWESLATVATR